MKGRTQNFKINANEFDLLILDETDFSELGLNIDYLTINSYISVDYSGEKYYFRPKVLIVSIVPKFFRLYCSSFTLVCVI